MKKQNGITLISLIITIIIMVIIAGVSLSAIFSDDGGIIGKATAAVDKTEEAKKDEADALKSWSDYIEQKTGIGGDDNRTITVGPITQTENKNEESGDVWSKIVSFTIDIAVDSDLELDPDYDELAAKKQFLAESMGVASWDELLVGIGGQEGYEEYIAELGMTDAQFVNQAIAEQGLVFTGPTVGGSLKKKELAMYMVDCETYEEFVALVDSFNADYTYEETIAQLGFASEAAMFDGIITNMRHFINYDDIKKLESFGVKVATVTTPYNTTVYTNSLIGGQVKCGFVKNGDYTFKIKSGSKSITQNVKVEGIREYDSTGPHMININNAPKYGDISYKVDDGATSTTMVRGNNSVQVNDKIELSTTTANHLGYVNIDEEFYKHYISEDVWFSRVSMDGYYMFGLFAGRREDHLTARQVLLQFLIGGYLGDTSLWLNGAGSRFADFLDDYYLPYWCRGVAMDEAKMKSDYPELTVGKYFYATPPATDILTITKDTNLYVTSQNCFTMDMCVEVVVWDDEKKKKIRKRKKVKDLTYDDEIVVWDFDKGEFTTARPLWIMKPKVATSYNLLKFSDGSVLKTINQHRIFNKEAGKFTYPMTDDTPIGTTTFTADGKEVTLVSKEKIVTKEFEYINIITEYHMNLFVSNILTSCRLSNLYPIEDMKYVKDNREIVGFEKYSNIPEEYYKGLRLGEQSQEINKGNDVVFDNSLEEYVQRLVKDAKEK